MDCRQFIYFLVIIYWGTGMINQKRIFDIWILIFVISFAVSLHGNPIPAILLKHSTLIIQSNGIAFLESESTESNAKALALKNAKTSALIQAGLFLESHPEYCETQITREEVITYSGRLLRTTILSENLALINRCMAYKVVIESTIDLKRLIRTIAENKRNNDPSNRREAYTRKDSAFKHKF